MDFLTGNPTEVLNQGFRKILEKHFGTELPEQTTAATEEITRFTNGIVLPILDAIPDELRGMVLMQVVMNKLLKMAQKAEDREREEKETKEPVTG